MSKKNVIAVEASAAAVATLIIEEAKHAVGAESVGGKIAAMLRTLYVQSNGSDTEFHALFGNGKAPKDTTFVAGSIATAVRANVARLKDEEVKKSALGTLKARLSEARALRKLGGIPKDAETIRAAVKRYKEAKAKAEADKAAKPAETTKTAPVAISADATMNDIAEALSLWVSTHGNAASLGLAKALQDFMPVTIKRGAKVA